MDRKSIDKIIEGLSIGSKVTIKWDRGNGIIKKVCILKGYNPKNNIPLFYPEISKVPLDLLKIGYDNLISIKSFE